MTPFRPATFAFLRDLRAHNDREWFQANKARYTRDVLEPSLEFIRSFYRGDGKHGGLEGIVDASKDVDYPVIDLGDDPESDASVRVRIGQYGPFVQRGEGGPGNTASIPDDLTMPRISCVLPWR